MNILNKPVTESFRKVTFTNSRNVFFSELKKRTKEHLASSLKGGDKEMIIKAVFFLSTYITCLVAVLFFPMQGWIALLVCIYMGLAAAAIGFNLMHDGSHGSFSDKSWLNNLAAYSIHLLGGDAVLWKNKHNIIHHTFTNIDGHDQDIALEPVLRSCVSQKRIWFHKYQHVYCFLAYALSSILWIFLLDFIKYFTGKVGNIKITGMTVSDHIIFWCTKILYICLYLILPAIMWGWSNTIIGFMAYHIVLGTTLSVIFQLAHVVEHTEFTDEHLAQNNISDEWAIHQLKTTANFATGNKFISWYSGGLNFQVEHHLFPKISHVHYPALNKIVKQLCMEMNISYHEYSSFSKAIQSHLSYLKKTGSAK